MPKYKVLCPGDAHQDHRKILFGVDIEDGHIKGYLFHCDYHGCRKWYQAKVSGKAEVVLLEMPANYHFDFERLPTLVANYGRTDDD